MLFQAKQDYATLQQLALEYNQSITEAYKVDTLHPGMLADLGVCLYYLGKYDEATCMFELEKKKYPYSAAIISAIQETLKQDNASGISSTTCDTISEVKLRSLFVDSVLLHNRVEGVAAVIDSSDIERVMLQTPKDSVPYVKRLTATEKRILLEQQQEEARRHKIATADSIAAAKKAKMAARKQEKIDREKARKQAQKAKKAEKRQKSKTK
ncbi:MAG: DUF4810 domain-containing protein [Bacteroidales bacterium]|nr:DUF4810 domain-containing protein [Bacteroidales bacterium]